jgi:hypothetical protein
MNRYKMLNIVTEGEWDSVTVFPTDLIASSRSAY